MIRRTRLPRGGPSAEALAEIERSMQAEWDALCAALGATNPGDRRVLAESVVQDPSGCAWRVVDAALDHLRCEACGCPAGAGPVACSACRVVDGMRYLAAERDRPGVPRGNEHGLRVATAVARNRHRYSATARCGYELALPHLLAGELWSTRRAQAIKARINRLGPAELESIARLEDLPRVRD